MFRFALYRIGKQTGLSFKGAYLNLDGGFDATSNRKAIFNAGMMPNIKENSRNLPHRADGCKRTQATILGDELNAMIYGCRHD